jgi:hypothetical protein
MLKRATAYLMRPIERDRLYDLISSEAWAKTDLERLRKSASAGDGLGCLPLRTRRQAHATPPPHSDGLLGKYGNKAHLTVRAADRT